MKWFKVAVARLKGFARGDMIDREIDEELRCHIEMVTEANIRSGMAPAEARRAAMRSFGNFARIKDMTRDIRGGGMLDILWQDLRFGLRMLAKRPGFTLVAVTALALGIGANTAIFSVVNTVLLRPLPFEEPERIVSLFGASVQMPDTRGPFSYPNFADYKARSQTLENVAVCLGSGAVLAGSDGPEVVFGADVSAELFPILGVQPALGRVFTPEEDKEGAEPVIVLSHDLWQTRFGGDTNIIGQTIKLSGSRTVIGVMPAGFKFPIQFEKPAQYWGPFLPDLEPRYKTGRDLIFLPVVAKLKPGVTIEQAQAELNSIAASLEAEYPDTNTGKRIRVVSLHEDLVGKMRPALLILFGAVGFVLLIACANVANLLLARASGRGKEMAVRTALGASRARIVRQLLVESLLLSFLGAGLGLLLATWGLGALVAVSPADLPRMDQVGLDRSVLGFTLIVSVMTGILFGLTPALQASKVNLNDVMKEGSRGGGAGGSRRSLRNALVVGEVAMSVVLVIGAGLLIKSFARLTSVDAGYEPEGVLAMSVPLSGSKFPKPEQKVAVFQQVMERARQLPGVESAAVTTLLPIGEADIVYTFNVEGRPPTEPGNSLLARYQIISPGYFDVLKMPMLRGRAMTEQDTLSSPHVVVINESFARRYFPDEDPIGKRLVMDDEPVREIVGVVKDVRQRGLDEDVVPVQYVSSFQSPKSQMDLVVRATSGNAAEMAPAIRRAIREINKDQLIFQVRTLSDLVSKSVAPRRFNMILLGVFALVALVLAATGIFGVMSFTVAQRAHEIGVRIALGAQRSDILKLVVAQGMMLTTVGVVLGLAAAFGLTRLMSSLLFGVSATDPVTFGLIAVLLTAVALVACYIPARRATKVDPILALRYE